MKNVLKNKIIIISLIFLTLITSVSNVFAYTCTDDTGATYSYPDNVVEYIQETEYYNDNYICLGFYWASGKYYVFFFEKTDDLKVSWGNKTDGTISFNMYHFRTNVNFNGAFYQFDSSGNYKGKNVLTNYTAMNTYNFKQWWGADTGNSKLFFANGDIYNHDGTLFFQAPPPIVEEQKAEITQILLEETQKVQIMQQMKTMIVGFLKYLIVLVVSLVAFWKGWQFLSMQLKKG